LLRKARPFDFAFVSALGFWKTGLALRGRAVKFLIPVSVRLKATPFKTRAEFFAAC
jgi:hypothetical protein